MSDRETYLGDGLYASFDGYQVRLRAPRDGVDHEVFLERLDAQGVPAVSRRTPDKKTELIEPDADGRKLGGFRLPEAPIAALLGSQSLLRGRATWRAGQ